MEFMERLITTLLDGKFASFDAKKELSTLLGIKVDDILGFELLTDELEIHQAIAVTIRHFCTLSKSNMDKVDYDYITVNSDGNMVLVIYDEPK